MLGRVFKRKPKSRKQKAVFFDYNLLAVVIILIGFGLVMLYSASAYEAANDPVIQNDMFYFRRQLFNSLLAMIGALIVSNIDYHILIKLSPAMYIVAFFLQAAVRFTPLGVTVNGARRWLNLGVQFQPSEIAKIAIICFMPYMIMKMGRNVKTKKGVYTLIGAGLIQALAAYKLTDNLSTGIIIGAISVFVTYLAHPKTKPFLIRGLFLAAVGGFGLFFIKTNMTTSDSFRLRRILAWLNPENHLQTGGHQVLQGLYAIGSGGFFGKGLGNSTQKLATIPEAQNDMIFSIICEELGLFGALLVMILFGYLLFRLFVLAQNAPDLYGTLVASGIFIHVALQVILNIAVVLNMMPTTGVTLPFVSYGGTSIIFLMAEIGIALNISRSIRYRDEDEKVMDEEKENGKITEIAELRN